MYMDMFIYFVRNADIFSGIHYIIHFFWCNSFIMFKQSKGNISWLKFSIKMVKVLFQNNKNWASYKCLVRKSVNNFPKIGCGIPEMALLVQLCTWVLQSKQVYMSIKHFQVVRSQKLLGCTCHMQKKIENWLISISIFFHNNEVLQNMMSSKETLT